MTELELHTGGNALALDDMQPFWNDHQLAALRQLGVSGAGNGDLAVFHHVCQRTGLDPFARQIYMIERQGKQTIQTGIDGFRLVARRAVDRTGEKLSIGASEWADESGAWTDVWLKLTPPTAARVIVYRDGEAFPGTALWSEYQQTKRDGSLTAMWASRPAGQLAKCAEALALRKAFPNDLSGVYSDDEMARDERRSVIARRTGGLSAVLDPQTSDPDPVTASAAEPPVSSQAGAGESSGSESPLLDVKSDLAKAMFASINEAEVTEAERLPWISSVISRDITSSKQMTEYDARLVLRVLDEMKDETVDGEVVE